LPFRTHPAAEPQERRHRGSGVAAGDRAVEFPVHRGHDAEQGLVERGHDRPDLVDGVHRLDPQLRGPPQQVDLLAQLALSLSPVRRRGALVVQHVEQPADPAQRGHHRAAARLGGVRGEHQVHPQRLEQLAQVLRPGVAADLGHRGGQRLPHRLLAGVAFPQVADALVFLGQVGQVKVDGEGPGDLLGLVQAPGCDQPDDLVAGRGQVVFLALARLDHRPAEPLHVGQQLRPAGVADDRAENVAEQPDVTAHRLGERGPVAVTGSLHGSVHASSVIRLG